MQLPIIVVENGDLDLFASQSDAEEHLETYDVAENRLKAYDAGGVQLQLRVLGRRVTVGRSEGAEHDDRPVRAALRKNLAAVGQPRDNGVPLADLVRDAIEHLGYTGSRRWSTLLPWRRHE